MKKFYKDQNGAAIAVFFVILIPLLFLALVGVVTFTNAITNSDITVQESVAISAKAAAMAMDADAQANGVIRIDADKAHENFKKSLCETLGLKDDLSPNKSFTSNPEYWLIIYNVDNKYPGFEPATLYHYVGTDGYNTSLAPEYPATFSIFKNPETLAIGSGGDYEVELKTPGVLCVVKINASNIANKSSSTIVRWAAARIVPGKDSKFKISVENDNGE